MYLGTVRVDLQCLLIVTDGIVKIALWVATILVTAAVAFPYVAPVLLGV